MTNIKNRKLPAGIQSFKAIREEGYLYVDKSDIIWNLVNNGNKYNKISNPTMSQIVNYGREMIRINTQKNHIEYSTNNGISWHTRYTSNSCGTFLALLPFGSELLACTSRGICYSKNAGSAWHMRYISSSCGNFIDLTSDGSTLLATTSKGLYYSKNSGLSWHKR